MDNFNANLMLQFLFPNATYFTVQILAPNIISLLHCLIQQCT